MFFYTSTDGLNRSYSIPVESITQSSTGNVYGRVKTLVGDFPDDYGTCRYMALQLYKDALPPAGKYKLILGESSVDIYLDVDGSLENVVTFDALATFGLSSDFYYNALRFDVVIDGESVVLLFPPEHIDSLYIDSQDRLFNLSTQTG